MSSTQTDLNAAAVLLAGQPQPAAKPVGVPVIYGGKKFKPVKRFRNGQADQPFSQRAGITHQPDGAHTSNYTQNEDGSQDMHDTNLNTGETTDTGHLTADQVTANSNVVAENTGKNTCGSATSVLTNCPPPAKTEKDPKLPDEQSYTIYYIGAALVLAVGIYFYIKM
jgi:hypothetical protein